MARAQCVRRKDHVVSQEAEKLGPALLYNQPSPGNSLQKHPSATWRPRTTSKHCNLIQFPPSQHQQFLTSGLNVSMSSGAASHSNHSMAHAAHTPSPFAPMDLEVLSVSFGVTQHVPSVSEGGSRMQSPVCHQSGWGGASRLCCSALSLSLQPLHASAQPQS